MRGNKAGLRVHVEVAKSDKKMRVVVDLDNEEEDEDSIYTSRSDCKWVRINTTRRGMAVRHMFRGRWSCVCDSSGIQSLDNETTGHRVVSASHSP